ncbi:28019_t:CDS:2 [Racocetra persica]|uniref:28019_t:CDS:1 n=1 Tax=Racocetra persica TaxID=160502 RepID=A0ACA9N087_9GLOM|nr:28019_t:CDS:2 [Racocetra persica]
MGRPARRQQFSEHENFTNSERMHLCNNCRINAYNPTWKRLCPECGSQLLSSEPTNFCCNNMLRRTIPPLHPLPLNLQNLYVTNPDNFSHNSHQYSSLFSFTVLGYTGGIVHLPHPQAFAINGFAYHRVYPANTKGYPTNWFVYDADARNSVADQCKLNQEIVDLIKRELAIVNPFVKGLYQLCDVDYPQARLIIQQPTNNAEVAACTIIHSTSVMQERRVQIWRVGEENPIYIIDMFSQADDEHLQYIRQEQYRFRKKNYDDNETVHDEAELYPKNIYLPALHTLLYRWSYKKTMDAFAVKRGLSHAHKGLDRVLVTVQMEENNDTIDEIKDYINAHYLSAMEAVWHIFKYKIASQLPSVTYLVNQPSLPLNTYLKKKQEGCRQHIFKLYKQNHVHITRMNIICLCVGEKYYLRLLLSCRAAWSFKDLCIVNNILYSNFQDAARAFGLLKDINKNEQCFAEAIFYKCTSAQLRLLFCHLILEGIAAQSIWQNYHELLLADYIDKKDDIQQGENEALI